MPCAGPVSGSGRAGLRWGDVPTAMKFDGHGFEVTSRVPFVPVRFGMGNGCLQACDFRPFGEIDWRQ